MKEILSKEFTSRTLKSLIFKRKILRKQNKKLREIYLNN